MRVLAEDANLLAADAGDALEEGLLPGLKLDELHALERLGGGVDARAAPSEHRDLHAVSYTHLTLPTTPYV